jgi:hypothetical protein
MKSILEKKLTYRALGFLYQNDFLIDSAMENPSPELQEKFKIKNVCAPLAGVLVERLETTLSLLSMSKGEFITSAIIDALDKADAVMLECGVDEQIADLAKRQEVA